ncbi:hypothetical protein PG985_007890 [Apiospora marii]|uniref:Uncharacterized protein n=1 Tax=Apiospora marii TaxID=335849 RepID=A0ABR1R8V7_9PEZI
MAPTRDVLPPVTARRRKNVCTEIKNHDAKYNQAATLNTLVETARKAVQEKWRQEAALPPRNVGVDFYQWHIDRTMFEYVIRHRPFQYVRPELNKQPYSVEWQAVYDDHQRSPPEPPRVVPDDRRIEPAPAPGPSDPVDEIADDLNKTTLQTEDAAPTATEPPSRPSEAAQQSDAAPEPVQGDIPKSAKNVTPKSPKVATPKEPPRPVPVDAGKYTFVYSRGPRSLYVMPAVSRDELWRRLFPGVHKFRGCEAFMMLFPPRRDFKRCVAKDIRRINELLDNRFVHLVWGDRIDQHGQRRGRCLTLSVARPNTNLADIVVVKSMRDGWFMLTQWLQELVSSDCADVEMAAFFEAEIAQRLFGSDSLRHIDDWNLVIADIDDIVDPQ